MMKKQVLHYTESHNAGLKLKRKNLEPRHKGGNDLFPGLQTGRRLVWLEHSECGVVR